MAFFYTGFHKGIRFFSTNCLILLAMRFLFLREGIEDQAGSHPEETNQEGPVIGFRRIGISRTRERFDDFSQKRHEDRRSRHRKKIDEARIEVLSNIERLNFTILPVPNNLIFQAAEYKAQYALSYADFFALASAVEYQASMVTGDPDFKKVEHLVEIVWV